MQPIAFVDLETTGGNATRDRITEVAIIQWDGQQVERWSTLINPQVPVPSMIQALTGINDAMLRRAPTFAEVADEIRLRLGGHVFVAHNARFDFGFLKNEFRRIEQDFRAQVLCTVKLSRRLNPAERRHSLDVLIDRYGLKAQRRHRATDDADLLLQLWHVLEANYPPKVFADAVKHLTGRQTLPPNLDAEQIDALPHAPGVYLFYGENNLPLYVGKARDVRTRVMSHFAADVSSAKEMSLSQQVRRVDWHETGGELSALLKEAQLVKTLQPILNRQLRRKNDLCTFRVRAAPGSAPELLRADDLQLGVQSDLYGLFESRSDALRALTSIADAHGLCHALLKLQRVDVGRPCFAHQIKKCRGACVGAEAAADHHQRLLAALALYRIRSWPFDGPAFIRDGHEMLLVDQWRFLGAARSEPEMADLLASGRPAFDRDTYKILSKAAHRLERLPDEMMLEAAV